MWPGCLYGWHALSLRRAWFDGFPALRRLRARHPPLGKMLAYDGPMPCHKLLIRKKLKPDPGGMSEKHLGLRSKIESDDCGEHCFQLREFNLQFSRKANVDESNEEHHAEYQNGNQRQPGEDVLK